MQHLPDIETLGRPALCANWQRIFKSAPPGSISQPMMRRVLAFEQQAQTRGGLDRATRQAIARTQRGCAKSPPRLKPGARLLREWNGQNHVVDVTEEGFLWHGDTYRSLSAIARGITGAHWSGPRFFGLTGGKHGKG
ncbi:hypothetical protein A9Q96_08390 [Rhodobacterales bacterium 52_120_T64]|nr:hypothetical protein A9Q96_08390 [Rhodobacterales bacterium 52_120_T64]